MVPLTATFLYVLTVFSSGLSGDVAGRRSMYPARLFTLPVSTDALTGWPMLYGGGAMVILWLATRSLAVWPSGVDIPVVWPALTAVTLLAWTQALMWMPYGCAGWGDPRRSVAEHNRLDGAPGTPLPRAEAAMIAIVVPQIPLAYVVARVAVARARRGDVPDWGAVRAPQSDRGHPGSGEPISRRSQRTSVVRVAAARLDAAGVVAILLPFELALLRFPATRRRSSSSSCSAC